MVEALIACTILSTAICSTTFLSRMSSSVQTNDTEEALKNILNVLSDPDVIREVMDAGGYFEAELNTLVMSLLPPNRAYGLKLVSAITGETIWTGSSRFEETLFPVSDRRTVTISLPVSEVKYRKIDVMLVMDRSGSMGWKDENGDVKIELAKEAAKLFVDQLNMSQDRVGLASFATEATLDSQLTFDVDEIKNRIDGLNAYGWTNIGGGIKRSNEELLGHGRSDAFWVLILLSDGVPNFYYDGEENLIYDAGGERARQYAIDQADIAKNLAGKGVKIYTIGLGASDYLDEELLKEIAAHETRYFNPPTAEELADIYLAIAVDILFRVRYDIVIIQLTLFGAM